MTGSRSISTRIGNNLFLELCDYALENRVHLSDILKESLLFWSSSGKQLPDRVLAAADGERANLELKSMMRKVLFVHNVQRKMRRLVSKEGITKEQIPTVIVPLIKGYRAVAVANQWKKISRDLGKILADYKSKEIQRQQTFMNWIGLSILGKVIQ